MTFILLGCARGKRTCTTPVTMRGGAMTNEPQDEGIDLVLIRLEERSADSRDSADDPASCVMFG